MVMVVVLLLRILVLEAQPKPEVISSPIDL
jgi:hypothetical protein